MVLLQVIKQSGDRNEPAVLLGQPSHKGLKSGVERTLSTEGVAKMGVHYARAGLGFKAVLIVFSDGLIV